MKITKKQFDTLIATGQIKKHTRYTVYSNDMKKILFESLGSMPIGVTEEDLTIDDYVLDLLNNKPDKTELFSGDYEDLDNKPTIPTKTSELVNDTNYVDENFVNSKLTAVYKFKGSVANYAALPTADLVVGDVCHVLDTGDNYAWTGTAWDKLAGIVDLS